MIKKYIDKYLDEVKSKEKDKKKDVILYLDWSKFLNQSKRISKNETKTKVKPAELLSEKEDK